MGRRKLKELNNEFVYHQYSDDESDHLLLMEEVRVSTLSEFLAVLSVDKFEHCYFRGENCDFPFTLASGFREENNKPIYNVLGSSFLLTSTVEEFKRDVWHKIDTDERTSFLAFCQHHGIPTNLLDISTSPLVALYFACQPSKDTTGIVKVFSGHAIDITDIVDSLGTKNFLSELLLNVSELQCILYEKMIEYAGESPLEFHGLFCGLVRDYYTYDLDHEFEEFFHPEFCLYEDNRYAMHEHFLRISWTIARTLTKEIPNLDKYLEQDGGNNVVRCYMLLLLNLLQAVEYFDISIPWIGGLPNFIYRPYLTFERGRNQASLFFYQTSAFWISHQHELAGLMLQRLWCSKKIIIENKEDILRELDFIGINKKFIYNDFDSIAAYIREKHSLK